MSQPDLFVVCRNCGSEVSPYVTECPYCGQRVRKRAPKLDRSGEEVTARAGRRRPRLPRLRAVTVEAVAAETRPTATIALIAISLLATLAMATGEVSLTDLGGILVPIEEDGWRALTAPFVHDNLGYQFVALAAVGVFGTLLERRFGWFAPVAIFLLAGAGGAAAATAADVRPLFEDAPIYFVLGANGAALGLLFAWLVEDRRAGRRGHERGSDLVGAWVFAAVLLLLPLAVPEASVVAAGVGVAVGTVSGLVLSLLGRG